MTSIVYLIIVISTSWTSDAGLTSQAIPQANWTQCSKNARALNSRDYTTAYCVTGVG